MQELATIGYEGADLRDFIATLLHADVSFVVDIREVPISRRKGFSKGGLSSALEEVGIRYLHLRGLGDPKVGREAARAGDHKKFLEVFTAHMETVEAKRDLATAIVIAQHSRACLLCYERDPKQCHRTLVANSIISRISAKIKHLGVSRGIAANGRAIPTRKGTSTGQSAAACR